MITTVVFDADDTLVDIRTAVSAGLAAVSAATGISVEEFAADAEDYWQRVPEWPARDIRLASLRETLGRHGIADRLDATADMFFAARYAHSRPFPGVLDVLAKLRTEFRLGYATNANSRAELCGLGGQFAFEIYATHNGVPKKPDPGFFLAVCAAAAANPPDVVYVGDSYEHDVLGGAGAGVRTVWLNRTGAAAPAATDEIDDLAALPALLARWNDRA